MEKYCRACQRNRNFILIAEDDFEDTYRCEKCDLQSKKKTRLGLIANFSARVAGGEQGVFGTPYQNISINNQSTRVALMWLARLYLFKITTDLLNQEFEQASEQHEGTTSDSPVFLYRQRVSALRTILAEANSLP